MWVIWTNLTGVFSPAEFSNTVFRLESFVSPVSATLGAPGSPWATAGPVTTVWTGF